MKKSILALIGVLACLYAPSARATLEQTSPSQGEFERSINSVVRNKTFYKAGRIEVGPTIGTMPYDSVVNHYLAGGRLTWHLSDHYGWEILDAQLAFPTITSFTTDLATSKGLSNLQTTQLKMLLGTGLLLSPLYGKIRFIGHTVLYFDTYVIMGVGMAKTENLKFSSPASGSPATQTTLGSGYDPMIDLGFGFKIFLTNAFGLIIDFRDYLTASTTYGKKTLGSNFAVSTGLTFFLPTF